MFVLGVRPGIVLDRLEASIEQVLAPLGLDDPAAAEPHHALLAPAGNEAETAVKFVIRDPKELR